MLTSRRGAVCAIIAVLACFLAATAHAQDASTPPLVDDAGRKVIISAPISRVLAAGPPASILLYTLAPEKMIGWVRAPSGAEKAYLLESVRELPEYGRLTGRGNTANIEAVVAFKPDLIIDVGSTGGTYASLANNVQEQTKIPYALIDGALLRTPETYRKLGRLIGVADRAEKLAQYAEETLTKLKARIDAIPKSERPRVYYGRGVNGLDTGLAGSINLEVLELVGAINVAAEAGKGGLTAVSMEQVLAWNPDVVLALNPAFYRSVMSDPLWSSVKAIRDRRVYLSPALPYGWFDAPPGVNRLVGVRWLAAILYPQHFPEDLRVTTRDFYKLFYQVDLSDAQLDSLLETATQPR
jgi:iron complex transport system substrate-binding protein